MKINKKMFYVIFVLITATVVIFWQYNIFGKRSDLRKYHNVPGSYTISLPDKWITEEINDKQFLNRLVVSPGDDSFMLGNIAQLSVTVIASPSAEQAFSRPEEFLEWRDRPSEKISGTGLLKVGNGIIDGRDSVILAEVDMVEEDLGKSFWSVTAWFVNSGINYYINMMGNNAITDTELEAFYKILESFKFD